MMRNNYLKTIGIIVKIIFALAISLALLWIAYLHALNGRYTNRGPYIFDKWTQTLIDTRI